MSQDTIGEPQSSRDLPLAQAGVDHHLAHFFQPTLLQNSESLRISEQAPLPSQDLILGLGLNLSQASDHVEGLLQGIRSIWRKTIGAPSLSDLQR